jgi:hypothetical protein
VPRSRAGACRPRRQVASTYTVELNDLGLFTFKSLTEPDFVRIVTDQLDQLYADSATSDRVMTLALHPCVIGQPSGASATDADSGCQPRTACLRQSSSAPAVIPYALLYIPGGPYARD